MTGSDVTCAWCHRSVRFGERHGEGVCTVSVSFVVDTSRLEAVLSHEAREAARRFDERMLAERLPPFPSVLLSADTPLVSRSPWLAKGAVTVDGSMFEDGQLRVVVAESAGVEVFERIRDAVDEAQRLKRIAEQVESMLGAAGEQLLAWQRTVLKRALDGDNFAYATTRRRPTMTPLAHALAEVCPSCRTVGAPEYECGGQVDFTADGKVLHSPPQDYVNGSAE